MHCVGRAGEANPIQQNDVPSFFLSMLRSLVPSALLGVIASARADKTNQRIDVNVQLSAKSASASAMRRVGAMCTKNGCKARRELGRRLLLRHLNRRPRSQLLERVYVLLHLFLQRSAEDANWHVQILVVGLDWFLLVNTQPQLIWSDGRTLDKRSRVPMPRSGKRE